MSLLRRVERIEANQAAFARLLSPPAGSDLTFEQWLPAVSPGMQWDWPHLVHVREHLDLITAGELHRLMVFMPPRHGKSELVTIRYPAYRLERNSRLRVIVGSYNSTLAEKFSRRTRRICQSRTVLSEERTAVGDWETAVGGGLRAVGVGSGITGQGGNLIVVDDPIKSREEAHSEAYRERLWTWWTDDLYTRMEPAAAVVLILTRWHEDDLAGRILAAPDAADWTVISLPALAEANDPLGRMEGEALCPERFDEEVLAQIKTVQGSSFAALYQQRPSALEGAIFLRAWWRTFHDTPAFRRIVQSWDTAFKTGHDNDYSVCTTWGEGDAGYYLLDVWKQRVEFPALKKMVEVLGEQWKPSVVLVEDKASGQSLIQELRRDTRLPVMPVKVDTDKVARAYAVTPSIETGRVFVPAAAPWLADYLDNMAAFPNAAYDDEVDSTTQALSHMTSYGGGMGLFEYYRRLAAEQKGFKEQPASMGPTTRLRMPPGIGYIQVGASMVHPDADRVVTVPTSMAQSLIEAGYARVDGENFNGQA